MLAARTREQKAAIDKCLEAYGNKGDNEMMNMLVRSQHNVCAVKTTKAGHRDRFEMDLL